MQTQINTRQSHWKLQLTSSIKLLLRWSWFVALAAAVTTVSSFLIQDAPSVDSYTATLQVQIQLPPALATTGSTATTATFYSQFFVAPDTLSLVLPKHKDLQLSDLQSLVTATPIAETNTIDLSAGGDNPKDASALVLDVYQASLARAQDQRSILLNGLTEIFTKILKQSQSDVANTSSALQNLAAIHQETSFEYSQLDSLYLEQQDRVEALSGLLLSIAQQASGQDSIISLGSNTPGITTVPSSAPTQLQRLALSPLIGLIMGLGGVLLATRFSNAFLRGSQRELVLSHISSAVPDLPGFKHDPLAAISLASSPCLRLLRMLSYRVAESGQQLKLITVTSPAGHEGKSTIASGLAMAAAQAERRVCLVDAHIRRPVLHTLFNQPSAPGTIDSIRSGAVDNKTANIFSRPTAMENLSLQTIGQVGRETSLDQLEDLLPLGGLKRFIEAIRQQTDLVIIDCPSLLTNSSAAKFAAFSDIALVVVEARKSKSGTVLQAEALLTAMNVPYATVLNRAAPEVIEYL